MRYMRAAGRAGGLSAASARRRSIARELFQFRADGLGHFASADGGGIVAVGFEIVGDVLAFFDHGGDGLFEPIAGIGFAEVMEHEQDRKSTRLNSSHLGISYAVLCLI